MEWVTSVRELTLPAVWPSWYWFAVKKYAYIYANFSNNMYYSVLLCKCTFKYTYITFSFTIVIMITIATLGLRTHRQVRPPL